MTSGSSWRARVAGQHRLDAATRIFREYISKDAEIGDLADVTSPTSSPTRRRSSVANLDSEDLTVGLSGPCTDAIVAMLKAAHAGGEEGAAALTSDLFVEAQREISRPVHAAFRQVMGKKTLSDALGFSAQVESVMGIFERAAPPEHGALALAAWYRSLCNLRSSEGEAALKDATKQNPEVDPEYAAQCLVELNYSSSVGNFIRTQAGTGAFSRAAVGAGFWWRLTVPPYRRPRRRPHTSQRVQAKNVGCEGASADLLEAVACKRRQAVALVEAAAAEGGAAAGLPGEALVPRA